MPVRGYIVEMKEAGGDWKKIGESKTLEFKNFGANPVILRVLIKKLYVLLFLARITVIQAYKPARIAMIK
uniref:Uncharacterized protein n=1 Tax=Romanomermis culicivorax TaxID=13658 RepID=A0A915IK43_ROMCU